jgi:SAM-dependent methyltransferase
VTPALLAYLCDPTDKSALVLEDEVCDPDGNILSGVLVSGSGRRYPVVDGVPRFVPRGDQSHTVDSFGDEWNHFNFAQFRQNWLEHTVRNTFGSTEAFRGKVMVDAGAGSGAQSRWLHEYGASHVIALELSHSVDDVMKRNLAGLRNVDVVQCSIDAPPLRDSSISGIVMCHNVIQHTRSVEDTAHALWRLAAPGAEFVFNCYPKNDAGLVRRARLALYGAMRAFLVPRSFRFRLAYARTMSVLRFVPVLGLLLEKSMLMVRGDVPRGPGWIRRAYQSGALNTFDCYGSHAYQHLKPDDEIRALVRSLQPDPAYVSNLDRYFERPQPIGIALRLRR